MPDFSEAILNPTRSFKDLHQDLVNGNVVMTSRGRPWQATGGYAKVYKFETLFPKKTWAIKCFTRLPPDIDNHYKLVSQYIKTSSIAKHFVSVAFFKEGIRTKDNKVHPILKMEWAQGEDLRTFIKNNLHNPHLLKLFAQNWLELCVKLTIDGVAHGDIQHDNISVREDKGNIQIQLIDYDSLLIPSWGIDKKDVIKGIEGYQHPSRASLQKQCIQADYFSHLIVYLSTLALSEDSLLWNQLDLNNKEHLLFSLKDLQNPNQSWIFSYLANNLSPTVAQLIRQLEWQCQIVDIKKIQNLAEVTGHSHLLPKVTNLNLPAPILPKVISLNLPAPPKKWKPTEKSNTTEQVKSWRKRCVKFAGRLRSFTEKSSN